MGGRRGRERVHYPRFRHPLRLQTPEVRRLGKSWPKELMECQFESVNEAKETYADHSYSLLRRSHSLGPRIEE